MADPRLLVVRLSSMGDIVHALPAVDALRAAHPAAQLDWVVERKWTDLLAGCLAINEIIPQDRGVGATLRLVRELRARRYGVAVDFQGLYKSAALVRLSGARKRIGFAASHARESGAANFYTERIAPSGPHVVEMNLALARAAGASAAETAARFPLQVADTASAWLDRQIEPRKLTEFYVLCPGGGWRSKCWPAEQYGHLHRKLAERHGWRGIVTYGPGERALAEAARLVAGEPEPFVLGTDVAQLKALLRRAKFVVAADTGPLHLAAGLGTPVVGLFGPTDPQRNGPYGQPDSVVRNARPDQTTYQRGRDYSPLMLSVRVEQVIEAVERRLGISP
jgi:lipopolysaccharide heptosyltransferase I